MKSDLSIAQSVLPAPIQEVAKNAGLTENEISLYGNDKAKILPSANARLLNDSDGKLILVTAINPTPAGEGKTTVSIGLAQSLCALDKKAVLALREPSLGPVFGVKGGAAGGGLAQVIPMESINLHFTGDMHAVTAANNLLCAMIDNHVHHGNSLQIDPRRILFRRCMDSNDRALRQIVIGLGGAANGLPREDGFIITVASEVMAILCLAQNLEDLKERLGNILIGFSFEGTPIFANDLQAQGGMAALLSEALCPNLVQTLTHTPAIVHGGPFANIAHGCNSVQATKLALKLGDYAVTEAGFGSDLGAEKFLDIKCRMGGLNPNCVVLVATVRALKYHGGADLSTLKEKNIEALQKGLPLLQKHIENMQSYGLPVVVAFNRFADDSEDELTCLRAFCKDNNWLFALTEVHAKGAAGGVDLARQVLDACEQRSSFTPLYGDALPLLEKMEHIAKKIYGASSVSLSKDAQAQLAQFTQMGFAHLPVCIAKTQYSLSDDPKKRGVPKDFTLHVRACNLNAGAGFVVAYAGNILTMPGLPKEPAALSIDVEEGQIKGLF